MATATEPSNITPTACPLARDRDGNAIPLPTGASAWRVRRKTGGRPRIVLGVDKQPMQLPLGYTIVDIDDILAPGEYLLDLVDAKGSSLDVTVPVAIGQLRNADGEDVPDEPTVSATLPTTGSEVRLVLEANVRATQMAFQHNEKTLELGLRMAETLRDGVRFLAESQADWIKSMASAKGFFRNAAQLPPLPPAPEERPANDDDGDEPAREDWVDKLTPLVAAVVPQIISSFMSRPKSPAGHPASDIKLDIRDVLDWRRIPAKRAEAAAKAAAAAQPQIDANAAAHFLQIQQALTPDEAELARGIAAHLPPSEVDIWLRELHQLSVPEAVAKIRTFLAAHDAKPTA